MTLQVDTGGCACTQSTRESRDIRKQDLAPHPFRAFVTGGAVTGMSLAFPQLLAYGERSAPYQCTIQGLPCCTVAGFPAACCRFSSPKPLRQPASLAPQPCLSPRVQRGRRGDATPQPASPSATSGAATSLHLAHCSQMPAVDSACPDFLFLNFPFPLLAGSCHRI